MRETITEDELKILYSMALDLEALMEELKSDNSLNTMMALLGYPAPKNIKLFAEELRQQAQEQLAANKELTKKLDMK